VLSIAGSDSGGGAGIQADLKAFAACRVHGMTAITAITAQNTLGVDAIHHVPGEIVIAQVRAVARDIGVDAVKIGMLGRAETIEAVAAALEELEPGTPVVLDPVMVAESGAQLLEPAARRALVELLAPRAQVITPNLPEARALADEAERGQEGLRSKKANESGRAQSRGGMIGGDRGEPRGGDAGKSGSREPGADSDEELARTLLGLGPTVVVITGGHRRRAADLFYDGEQLVEIDGERYPSGAAHGSGCTHSSVLAARLAWGASPLEAAREAKRLAALAVAHGLAQLGRGAGPVDVLGLAEPPAGSV
jgi:hydroxymethylpyrimidine/phosphomethylpyrimidine kinase